MKYILNPDKTEELLYTASVNCMTDAESAHLQMQLVYDQVSGNGCDKKSKKTSFYDLIIDIKKQVLYLSL